MPAEPRARSWPAVLRRTVSEYRTDNLGDWAAALTYYGILSIFPALLALVSILGLVGHAATQPLIENLGKVAPGAAKQIFTGALENLQRDRGAAGVLLIAGLGGALWSASGYVGAFMRASNAIYDIDEGRPLWKTVPIRLATTLVLVVLLAITALAVVFTGGLARRLGGVLGVSATAVSVWDIAKWPLMVLLVAFMFTLLYWASQNARQRGIRSLGAGGLLAVLLWLLASGGFALYVASFGSYNKTYGTLGGVIVFLVWLWISNVVLLLGAEFNAELGRGQRIEAGHPPQREPFVEPRDTATLQS
jgi:membrane protein